MVNEYGINPEERDAISQMMRSEGWKIVMRRIITPLIVQTNARLDAMGTPEFQTQFHRGVKQSMKRFMEELYQIGQMPNPFEEHMRAFLITLDVQHQPEKEAEITAESIKREIQENVRRRGFSPVF